MFEEPDGATPLDPDELAEQSSSTLRHAVN